MKINLKDYYPFYGADFILDVPEEIVLQLKMMARKEHAEYERRRRYKALYSLESCRGFEGNVVLVVLSPEEIYEHKLDIQELYAAICSLPEKQARRIYAHFFLRLSKAAIARSEGVNRKTVCESIDGGLKNISNFLKKFS